MGLKEYYTDALHNIYIYVIYYTQSYYVCINCFVSFSILITPVMKSENKGIIIYKAIVFAKTVIQ